MASTVQHAIGIAMMQVLCIKEQWVGMAQQMRHAVCQCSSVYSKGRRQRFKRLSNLNRLTVTAAFAAW